MIAAVATYLAVRRAVGFTLSNTEYLLRSFAAFAKEPSKSLSAQTVHRVGQPSEVNRTTPYPLSDYLPLCRLPANRRSSPRIAAHEPLRLSENTSGSLHIFQRRDQRPCSRRREISIIGFASTPKRMLR